MAKKMQWRDWGVVCVIGVLAVWLPRAECRNNRQDITLGKVDRIDSAVNTLSKWEQSDSWAQVKSMVAKMEQIDKLANVVSELQAEWHALRAELVILGEQNKDHL